MMNKVDNINNLSNHRIEEKYVANIIDIVAS